MIKTCSFCKKQFKTYKRASKYCSRDCRDNARRDPSKKSIFVCKGCGKQFEDWTYRKTAFCSNRCKMTLWAKQPRPWQEKPERWVERNCLTCGKVFTVTVSQIELRNGGKYCSRKCFGKAQSQKMKETGGPNYKGGITQKNYLYYRGSNWDSQKRKALKRDNHECQVCHSRGNLFSGLAAHHIVPYRFFNGDFESSNQLSNLITLCRKHHGLVESGKIPCPKPKS
jgi:5-methylcytosine-specific restriction endonuclease McrA